MDADLDSKASCGSSNCQARNRWSFKFDANVVALIPVANTVSGQRRRARIETMGGTGLGKPSLISLAKRYLNCQTKQVRYLPLAVALRAGLHREVLAQFKGGSLE